MYLEASLRTQEIIAKAVCHHQNWAILPQASPKYSKHNSSALAREHACTHTHTQTHKHTHNLKTNLMKMIEVLKEENNKSLMETQETTHKQW